ncbi:MAG TPA: cupin domain-containing protein [Allosphingosinicella sp.]|nr:cupin domain-containing protein [Allosphingosinicella sp.]
MPFTFRDVLGSFDTAAIAEGMAERRLIHRPEACGVRPEALFSLEDLEQLVLRDGMDRKDFRVTVNGRIPNLEMLGLVKDQRLRPLVLRQLARQGASIIVNDLHRYDSKFSALADDAERVLQDRVAIAAIASFSKLPALPAHYDPQDLIIVQVEGSKVWRFFGEPADCGVANHPRVKVPEDVSATVTMRPGDILFVPAGLHHQCEAEGISLHVGIVIKHEVLLDFLNDLVRDHPSLNRPLRPLLGSESVARQAAALRSELISRFDQADVAEWLAERNVSRARVTALDLRGVSDPGSAEGMAALTVTMIPPERPGRRWKMGGIDFQPGTGAVAVASALKEGPRIVREVLHEAGREVGPDEARAGLDQLVTKGIVQIERPGA